MENINTMLLMQGTRNRDTNHELVGSLQSRAQGTSCLCVSLEHRRQLVKEVSDEILTLMKIDQEVVRSWQENI